MQNLITRILFKYNFTRNALVFKNESLKISVYNKIHQLLAQRPLCHSVAYQSFNSRSNRYLLSTVQSPIYNQNCFISNESDESDEIKNPFIRKDQIEGYKLLHELIEDQDCTKWTDKEWGDFGTQISSVVRQPWEIFCMNSFLQDNLLDFGKSLMTFLENKDKKPNRFVTTFYIALLGKNALDNETCNEETKQYYDKYMEQYDLLDPSSITYLAAALANTSYYLDCLDLIERAEVTHEPLMKLLAPVLIASLRHHNLELTKDVLHRWIHSHTFNSHDLQNYLTKIFHTCLLNKNKEGLHIITDFMQRHDTLIQQRHLDTLVEVFHRLEPDKWIANYGYIHNKWNNCNICHTHMNEEEYISEKDYLKLRAVFEDQVIVGKNVFFKSTPEQLNDFKRFIDTFGPFDVIIDGLNVFHKNHQKGSWKAVENMVNFFTRRRKRVLVLGTSSMKNLKRHCRKLEVMPLVYACASTRADDVFYLYAALHSHRETLIVTRDKLRDHQFLFEPTFRPIFAKWLKFVKVNDWYYSKEQEELKIFRTPPFQIGPVEDEEGWHFPLDDRDQDFPYGRRSVLCLRNRHLTGEIFKTGPFMKKPRARRTKSIDLLSKSGETSPNRPKFQTKQLYQIK